MLCEKCKQRPAAVGLILSANGYRQQLHLCETCFAEVMSGQDSGINPNAIPGGLHYGHMAGTGANSSNDSIGGGAKAAAAVKTGAPGLLEQLARNLTQAAEAGKIDDVIGRDEEIERVIEILNRRNKNNPVLIGEAGVGKTAIVEGLAKRIAKKDAPQKLLDKQVYALDVSSLVSGTGIRGQFEEKMRQIIAEAEGREDAILFIDEIHQLVGAGAAEGSMDAANILKPALARGALQVIGATTLSEYRAIEKDAALERRFQPVRIQEPTVEDAVKILQGIRPQYEKYHDVEIPDETIRACVTLSQRYIADRFLPDKAIDLLDEAGARVNLRGGGSDRAPLEQALGAVRAEKAEATQLERYEEAAKLRDRENELARQLDLVKETSVKPQVTSADIQGIIERKTGIPVRKLEKAEQEKLKSLAAALGERVVGQQEAVDRVAKAVRRSRAGLAAGGRPLASFLFVGPTGVGKTELAKTLARELFGDPDAMIRLDMSEYMERHSVAKLIGAPPGYVGYDRAGQLTERVRRRPYSIVLLDEIEKAHPDVQNLFLQMLDDGRLTDSQGHTVSFKDTVVIMTSNAGAVDKKPKLGFAAGMDDARDPASERAEWTQLLKGYFQPEFLNRIDAIVPFHPLSEDHLLDIVELMLRDVRERLAEQGLALVVADEAKRWLAKRGYDPAFGARPLRRAVQTYLEDAIADALLESVHVQAVNVAVAGEGLQVAFA